MFQITNTLPRKIWKEVIITENNEPLVEILETEKIVWSNYIKQHPEARYIRKSLYEKLIKASEHIPKEYKLVIIEGHRSVQSQQRSWGRMWEKVKIVFPQYTDEEIEKQVRLYVAKPSVLANHNCGGAIDVTLVYTTGSIVDMGTLHPSEEDSAEAIPKFPMFSKKITKEQTENRKILREVMVQAEFVWYPSEWWHYCWGDRMWAVYTEQTECFYGPAKV